MLLKSFFKKLREKNSKKQMVDDSKDSLIKKRAKIIRKTIKRTITKVVK